MLLVVAMLAARFVPMLAVDVPDQYLLDLERLAVTAWSARDRPTGRRGRIIVPAHRGGRRRRARGAAPSPPPAWRSSSSPPSRRRCCCARRRCRIDVLGARVEVGLAGAALLLAARSYRHVGARALLRAAGLACWAVLLVVLLRRQRHRLDDRRRLGRPSAWACCWCWSPWRWVAGGARPGGRVAPRSPRAWSARWRSGRSSWRPGSSGSCGN